MSNTVSFAELDGQHVELLPARTVLSMFSAQIPIGDAESTTGSGTNNGADPSPSALSMLGAAGMMGSDGTNNDGGSGSENS